MPGQRVGAHRPGVDAVLGAPRLERRPVGAVDPLGRRGSRHPGTLPLRSDNWHGVDGPGRPADPGEMTASDSTYIVDADGHVCEPPDLWERASRRTCATRASGCAGTRPAATTSASSRTAWRPTGGWSGSATPGESFDDFGRGRHYEDLNPAGFDAAERVKVLDAEGIDVVGDVPGPRAEARRDPGPRARGRVVPGLQRLARRVDRSGPRPPRGCRGAADAGPAPRGRRGPPHPGARAGRRLRPTERVPATVRSSIRRTRRCGRRSRRPGCRSRCTRPVWPTCRARRRRS